MSRRLLQWLLGLLLCSGVWLAQAQTTVEYIHTDALGSVVAVTNEAGQVIERFDYEPYGAIIGQPNYGGVGFTGHVQDAATGLTYMQQRYYDPTLGRFLSVDPVAAYDDPVGMFNRYKYAANNPYRFIDPDGRQEKTCTGSRVSCPSGTQGAPQNELGIRSSGTVARGEVRPHTRGTALRANFRDNVDNSILGPGGKDAMHLLGDSIVDGMGHAVDGNMLPAAKSMTIGLILKRAGPLGKRVEDLIDEARTLYPAKAGKIELHHITPKYLGGAKNGSLVPLDAAYHQQITNEFRRHWPYGGSRPDGQRLEEVMREVYEKYPLP